MLRQALKREDINSINVIINPNKCANKSAFKYQEFHIIKQFSSFEYKLDIKNKV